MKSKTVSDVIASSELPFARIFRLYYPLAFSWIFMGLEGPIGVAFISRMPDATLNTAALTILMSMALLIESPVIDLLSTSTTLAKSRQNYLQIRRFTLWLMIVVTIIHALVAFTPLYGFITREWLGDDPQNLKVAQTAHAPMQIMVLWSFFIGWRRYLQGILIRNGQTHWIGIGTLVRGGSILTSCFLLSNFAAHRLTGIEVVAIALSISVFVEAAFIHVLSLGTLRRHYHVNTVDDPEPLTMRRLIGFHLPLTATTLVMFIGMPGVSAALARSDNQETSLAAWQVISTIFFLTRAYLFALPEIVISLQKTKETARALFRFCFVMGGIASGIMVILAIFGLDRYLFGTVLKAEKPVVEMAHIGFLACGIIPILNAFQNYVRGMLTAYHLTMARFAAVWAYVIVLALVLTVGVVLRWPGVINAAVATTAATLCELGVLLRFWFVGAKKVPWATA